MSAETVEHKLQRKQKLDCCFPGRYTLQRGTNRTGHMKINDM